MYPVRPFPMHCITRKINNGLTSNPHLETVWFHDTMCKHHTPKTTSLTHIRPSSNTQPSQVSTPRKQLARKVIIIIIKRQLPILCFTQLARYSRQCNAQCIIQCGSDITIRYQETSKEGNVNRRQEKKRNRKEGHSPHFTSK